MIFERCGLKMTDDSKIFLFEKIAEITFYLIIPERVKDGKLHLAGVMQIINLKQTALEGSDNSGPPQSH